MEPSILTTHDAARYLGLSPGTLTNWRSANRGPSYVKVGGRVRYRLRCSTCSL